MLFSITSHPLCFNHRHCSHPSAETTEHQILGPGWKQEGIVPIQNWSLLKILLCADTYFNNKLRHFLFPKCLIWTGCSKVLHCKTICFHVFQCLKKYSLYYLSKDIIKIPELGHTWTCKSSWKYWRFKTHLFYEHGRQLWWHRVGRFAYMDGELSSYSVKVQTEL